MSRKKTRVQEPFTVHTLSMLQSPAWVALPDDARRVLSRIEVEHMCHGGVENGNLLCTYDQFTAEGIRRNNIAIAIEQCVELGFLKVKPGRTTNIRVSRPPNLFRLTYVHNAVEGDIATNDWKRIATDMDANHALARAKQSVVAKEAERQAKREARKARQANEALQSVLINVNISLPSAA